MRNREIHIEMTTEVFDIKEINYETISF